MNNYFDINNEFYRYKGKSVENQYSTRQKVKLLTLIDVYSYFNCCVHDICSCDLWY